jgi:hypothetical protein
MGEFVSRNNARLSEILTAALPVHGKHERKEFSTREEKLSKQRRTFPIVREFWRIVDRCRGG